MKIVAIKENNHWINRLTRVQLSEKSGYFPSEELLEVEDFVILHQVLDLSHFEELLKSLSKGKLSVGNFDIEFKFESSSFKFLDDHETKYMGKRRFGLNWGVYYLRRYEQSPDFDFKKIELELKSHKEPYSHVQDAIDKFIGKGEAFESNNTYIIAPFYVALRDSEFEEDMLSVEIESHKSIKPNNLKLGRIAYSI